MHQEINIRLKPSNQFLAYVLMTILDDGIASWKQPQEAYYDPWFAGVGTGDHCVAKFHYDTKKDNEGMLTGRMTVNLRDVARGIQCVLTKEFDCHHSYKGRLLAAVLDDDSGEVDAELGDIIANAIFFGELVYS